MSDIALVWTWAGGATGVALLLLWVAALVLDRGDQRRYRATEFATSVTGITAGAVVLVSVVLSLYYSDQRNDGYRDLENKRIHETALVCVQQGGTYINGTGCITSAS